MALFREKEKEVYEEISSLIGDGDDYHVYHMTRQYEVTSRL